ncbi:uncharacterized protein [Ambystoma mexicanum]|uniref:uncharacterized protein isoform X3 n=1 Tax=Ambystoma mexicanum TaxID=8296 RepID=UPI0037E84345
MNSTKTLPALRGGEKSGVAGSAWMIRCREASKMETRLFEEEEHASIYQKYRFSLPPEMQSLVLSYLEEKKGKPFLLAADIGCGSGQCTRVLAPHFEKVVGTDISEAQIKEAKKVSGPSNISYCVCPAEELPFEDASLDLIMASSAAHWFNTEKFMKESNRVLKPRGCMALLTYTQHIEIHAKDCTEKLTAIFNEVEELLLQFGGVNIHHVKTGYKEIFDAIPFPEKESRPCPESTRNGVRSQEISIGHIKKLSSRKQGAPYPLQPPRHPPN